MAIKYTYSFNCTIKYRFKGETANTAEPKFSDSTALITFDSEQADISKLTLSLPNYLQGVEDGIRWYTDENYSTEVTSNTALNLAAWEYGNPVEVGTFRAYNATIMLYSNTVETNITWKYKNADGEDVEQTITYLP